MPRKGQQQQRAPRLTHRERVKLMLDSNRRIKTACAAVEVRQSAGVCSDRRLPFGALDCCTGQQC